MCGIHGPGGRVEDSRLEGPGLESRNWAKFQSCGETLKEGSTWATDDPALMGSWEEIVTLQKHDSLWMP